MEDGELGTKNSLQSSHRSTPHCEFSVPPSPGGYRDCCMVDFPLDIYTPMAYIVLCSLLRRRYSPNECWKP
jgi:hypothetical protein